MYIGMWQITKKSNDQRSREIHLEAVANPIHCPGLSLYHYHYSYSDTTTDNRWGCTTHPKVCKSIPDGAMHCNIPLMIAKHLWWVLILNTPYFTVCTHQGCFAIIKVSLCVGVRAFKSINHAFKTLSNPN